MITVNPETRAKSCCSCGRMETDKEQNDTGFKTIIFRIGGNTGSNRVTLCPDCYEQLRITLNSADITII